MQHDGRSNINSIKYVTTSVSSDDHSNTINTSRSFSATTKTTTTIVKASNACVISAIPCEIFIEICRYSHPVELVSLSFVCKKFRHWLLAISNFGTEQIWKNSRTAHLPNLLPPPKGLPEQCYVFLHLIELGCQFCGKGKVDPKGQMPSENPPTIYWMFKVRCCRACFLARTISLKQLKEERRFHRGALAGLPTYLQKNRPSLYWRSQVEASYKESTTNIVRHDDDMLVYPQRVKKSSNLSELTLIAKQCQQSSKPEPLRKWHQKARLKSVISQLSIDVPNDDKKPIEQVKVQLRRCPTYKKYTIKNPGAITAMRLFSDHHWEDFQNNIKKEYLEKRNYAALRARQFDLFVEISSQIPQDHPIYEYLIHCPSFKQPPFHNSVASIQWEESYLTQTLIPKLCQEVSEILLGNNNNFNVNANVDVNNNNNNDKKRNKSAKKQLPTTITLMAKSIFSNRKVFSCKLCLETTPENLLRENIKGIKSHLQSEHGITKKNPASNQLILVNFLEFGKNYLKRDSDLVCFFFPLNI